MKKITFDIMSTDGYDLCVARSTDRIKDGSDIMFTDSEPVTFVYEYPLSHKVNIVHIRKNGKWTRKDVGRIIQKDYAMIYAEEDGAVGMTADIPGTFNRGRSSGPHGIWGHGIGDLVIEGVTYDAKTHKVTLGIGS